MKRRHFLGASVLALFGLARGKLPTFPEPAPTWALMPEGSFAYLDQGTLDLGIFRDSLLDASNNFEIFAETFENVRFKNWDELHTHTSRDTGESR